MKQFLFLFSICLITHNSYAQLNQHFFGGGNATLNKRVGTYVSNITVGTGWREVQKFPTSAYAWAFLDSTIQANQIAGLRSMITLKCISPITSADTIAGTCAYIFKNQASDNGSSWWPYDTTKWKQFVNAFVDRYDGDGTNDMPGLIYPIIYWHIGQEWQRIWCTQNPPDSLSTAQEFVKYVNMTYSVIKAKQPNSKISFAGIDTRHDLEAYYDGYSTRPTLCLNQSCTNPLTINNPSQVALVPGFFAKKRNVLYILRNTWSDEIDIHQYGRWTEIPGIVQWLKDSANLGKRNVVFYEEGGPFCKSCENTYHAVSDADGRLPAELVRDNASYIVYSFISGLAGGVRNQHWHMGPEYTDWGPTWGDLDLLSKNYVPKPSFYTYRFLAKTVFANPSADTVIKITNSNPNLYHYRIDPLTLYVAWSMAAADSLVVTGNGTLYKWTIPTTCDNIIPTTCDSLVVLSTVNVVGTTTISLNNGVPVFYSWNNALSGISGNVEYQTMAKVFPVPTNQDLTLFIQLDLPKQIKYELFDLTGRKVLEGETFLHQGNNDVQINTKIIKAGVYILSVFGDGEFYRQKIVKGQ